MDKTNSQTNRVSTGLIVILTAWVFSGAPEYLSLTYDGAPLPILHAFILILALAIYGLQNTCQSFFISDGRYKHQFFWIAPILVWFFMFITLGYASIVMNGINNFAVMDLGRRVSAALFFLIFFLCLVLRQTRYFVAYGIVIGGIALGLTIQLGVLQIAFITPGSCRMGGLYLNANGAAYALICSLWVGSQIIESSRYKTIFQAFIVFCVLLTMSRAGFIGLAVIVFSLVVQRHIQLFHFATAIVVLIIGFGLAAWLQGEVQRGTCLHHALKDRFSAYVSDDGIGGSVSKDGIGGSVSKDGIGGSVSEDKLLHLDSGTSERLLLAKQALSRFQHNPLFGLGVDSVEGERSHNLLLALMSQHGVMGILIFVGFFVIIYKLGTPFSLVVTFFVLSMFDHNFLYSRFILITLVIGLYFGVRNQKFLAN